MAALVVERVPWQFGALRTRTGLLWPPDSPDGSNNWWLSCRRTGLVRYARNVGDSPPRRPQTKPARTTGGVEVVWETLTGGSRHADPSGGDRVVRAGAAGMSVTLARLGEVCYNVEAQRSIFRGGIPGSSGAQRRLSFRSVLISALEKWENWRRSVGQRDSTKVDCEVLTIFLRGKPNLLRNPCWSGGSAGASAPPEVRGEVLWEDFSCRHSEKMGVRTETLRSG